jgi:hypothetical protein
MRFIANALSIIFLITSSVSCREDEVLPPMTSQNAGTFGCIIDGKVYSANRDDGEVRLQHVEAAGGHSISIYANKSRGYINLMVRDQNNPIIENKPYYFDDQQDISCTIDTKCGFDQSSIIGHITFSKIDYFEGIYSGVFEYSAFSPDCKRTLYITDGRFDL